MEIQEREKKRIEYIDLAKGICIILVVFMHMVPELGKGSFLVNLRMPLYYFLSGMFFKTYGSFKNFSIKKTENLLIPFIAWYLISYVIYYLRVLTIGHPEHIFRITDLFLEPEFYNGPIWFLLSLFWCNILYFIIENISRNEFLRGSLVLFISCLGWLLSFNEFHNFLYFGTSLTCLPFFYIGRKCVEFKLVFNERALGKDSIIVGISLVVLGLVSFLPIELPQMKYYLNILSIGHPVTLYISAISMIMILLIICKYLRKVPYVSYLGRFSIIVLLTHGLLNNVIRRIIAKMSGMDVEQTWFQLILFIGVMALMAVIIPICRKYLPYICAQKPVIGDKLLKSKELSLSESK